MTETPPPVQIEKTRGFVWTRISFVWVIPFIALLFALGVAWQTYNDRGPLIDIEFKNGTGVAERETELRYRDVTVGVVENVKFTEGLDGVIAQVRVDKEIGPYIDASASFWIVQPEVTARGVTGLETVLSGIYIEGIWDGDIGAPERQFQGLEDAPIFRPGVEGLEIALRTTPGGSMTDNSPITYRGIEVGRVGKARISPRGDYAVAEALIFHPHSRLISSTTRFWETSGFTFSVGAQGAEIDFSSLATLVGGGLTFDTFVSGGGPASDGAVFDVFAGEAEARNSLFVETEVETLDMYVVFEQNVSGLAIGAPVEINGLKIGSVQSVLGVIDEATYGDRRVRLNVVLSIQPARLGLQGDVTPQSAQRFLSDRIRGGLRARLANAGLLTGGLKIDLVQVDDAAPVELDETDGLVSTIPTAESDMVDAAATIEGMITRINNLPIEELLANAIQFLDSAEAFIADEDLRETPKDVRMLLSDVRGIVTSDEVQNIPKSINASLTRLETILQELQEAELSTKLVNAVEAAATASQNVSSSVEGMPALVTQIQEVAAKVEDLPLEDLIARLTVLSTSADKVLDTDAARQLPADLGAALNEIKATLTALREGGTVENVNATLASARDAADAVATSAKSLPDLVKRMQAVLNRANTTIAGYDKGEVLTREAQSALRDIAKAADALGSLARMLERNPSAFIRGRN